MTYNDLVELNEDAEMIDLGVASLETEGPAGPYYEAATMSLNSPSPE